MLGTALALGCGWVFPEPSAPCGAHALGGTEASRWGISFRSSTLECPQLLSWLEKVSPLVARDTAESMGDVGEGSKCGSVRSQGTRGAWKSTFVAERGQPPLPCVLLLPQPRAKPFPSACPILPLFQDKASPAMPTTPLKLAIP